MEKPYHDYSRHDDSAVTDIHVKATAPVLDRLMVYFTHGLVTNDMLRALTAPHLEQKTVTEHVKNMKRQPNGLLIRPTAQEHDRRANCSFICHTLSDKGLSYLIENERITVEEAELFRKIFVTKLKKHKEFWHDAAAAHITASVELGCRNAGVPFIPWYKVLSHSTCPQTTRDAPNPLAVYYDGAHSMIPDALYGIGSAGKPVFHFLEFDNDTEGQSALTHKHKGYSVIVDRRLHTRHFGFTTMQVDYVTNAIRRLPNIQKGLRNLAPQSNIPIHFDRFRFKAVRELNRDFGDRVKATDHMFTGWQDVNGAPFQ